MSQSSTSQSEQQGSGQDRRTSSGSQQTGQQTAGQAAGRDKRRI